ncbi:MAG: hypothetical protein AB7F86_12195 [Bdellovibrionales bacterium]
MGVRIVMLLLSFTTFTAFAGGDLENFAKNPGEQTQKWIGYKRKYKKDKARLRRLDHENARAAYLADYQQKLLKMSAERQEALSLDFEVTLIRVSLSSAQKNCQIVTDLKKADQCLDYLRVILSKVGALRLRSLHLASVEDRELVAQAEAVRSSLEGFESETRQVFNLWLENKFKIRRALDAKDTAQVKANAEDRASCLTAPLLLQRGLRLLEKNKPNQGLYDMANDLDSAGKLMRLAEVSEKSCAVDLSSLKEAIAAHEARLKRLVTSDDFIQRYRTECESLENSERLGLNCRDKSPNLSVLYSLKMIAQQRSAQ